MEDDTQIPVNPRITDPDMRPDNPGLSDKSQSISRISSALKSTLSSTILWYALAVLIILLILLLIYHYYYDVPLIEQPQSKQQPKPPDNNPSKEELLGMLAVANKKVNNSEVKPTEEDNTQLTQQELPELEPQEDTDQTKETDKTEENNPYTDVNKSENTEVSCNLILANGRRCRYKPKDNGRCHKHQ